MQTILIIEDRLEIRENAAEILQLSSYHVLQAGNGKEGVELARKSKPDLILCDVLMPELDGYGVLHLLQRDPETAAIPFVFLTGKAEKNDLQKAMGLGADGYLIKPFDDISLLELVEIRLRKSAFLKQKFENRVEGIEPFLKTLDRVHEIKEFVTDEKKIIHIRKKHLIFTEGDYPTAAYFLSKGKVKAFKTNAEGREYITAIYKEGDFFGYTEIIENCHYTESTSALEAVEMYAIQRQDFYALLYSNNEVSHKFIRILAGDILEREERLLQLAYNSVRKRVADALLFMAERVHASVDCPDEEISTKQMHISREDLANLAGASKETVIRTLSDFKQERLIDITAKGEICFLQPDKLKTLRN
ncbi:response regulator [Xanthocytophaga agilis]|uniref:Response regulator n=1 Tax=Xanthocytophaga agilis TaxID=3048010 RepID=A0AAE3RA20_9BACT|nr:response regulator [Xanthocytophaga agilis]MDJ1506444.1 response regulator [Xanthocytophaga agilis]